jgi:hypothetical protein
MAYRYLRDPKVLGYAESVSAFWFKSVKPGGVPLWDFDAPVPTFEDTSSVGDVTNVLPFLVLPWLSARLMTSTTALRPSLCQWFVHPAISPLSHDYV